METLNMQLREIVETPFCVSTDDALRVYTMLNTAINEHHRVNMSFTGIEVINTAFMNAAFGQLIFKRSKAEVDEYLTISDVDELDFVHYQNVMTNAELYFKDPERMSAAKASVLDESE